MFIVSFFQGGTGVTCTPLSVFLVPLLCRLTAFPVVVVGGGQVYACYWGVGGSGLVVRAVACLPE